MAELADAHDSKSCGAIHVGSSPTTGTRFYRNAVLQRFFRYMDLLDIDMNRFNSHDFCYQREKGM